MNRHCTLALLLAALPAPAWASEDGQIWTSLTASGPVSGDFALLADAQIRIGDEASRLIQTVFRVGVGYQPGDSLSFYAGYARATGYRVGAPDAQEDRLWQQASYPLGDIGRAQLTGRTRLEQRRATTGDGFGWRFRQQLKAALPFRQGSRVRLTASAEILMNLNDTDWGVSAGLDQFRAFAGVNLPLASGLSLEAGYLNQIQRRAAGPDQMNHVASFSLAYRFGR